MSFPIMYRILTKKKWTSQGLSPVTYTNNNLRDQSSKQKIYEMNMILFNLYKTKKKTSKWGSVSFQFFFCRTFTLNKIGIGTHTHDTRHTDAKVPLFITYIDVINNFSGFRLLLKFLWSGFFLLYHSSG